MPTAGSFDSKNPHPASDSGLEAQYGSPRDVPIVQLEGTTDVLQVVVGPLAELDG